MKKIFKTIQGEGTNTGRVAVFVRFAGCNLWSGQDEDRGTGGSCSAWCDTEFVGGRGFRSANDLCEEIQRAWGAGRPMVVFTGGEPMLQLDAAVNHQIVTRGWEAWAETNGTVDKGGTWAIKKTVSPKLGTEWSVVGATEVKLVGPQPGLGPSDFERKIVEDGGVMPTNLYLQPMDGSPGAVEWAISCCLADPRWKLSLQTQKLGGFE